MPDRSINSTRCQTFAHGDASPENLPILDGNPAERVVIDWGFRHPLPIGFDLGQLLSGWPRDVHDPGSIPPTGALIEPACRVGSAPRGTTTTSWTSTPVLSVAWQSAGPCAIPFELLDAPATPELLAPMTDRFRLSRVMIDLAASLT